MPLFLVAIAAKLIAFALHHHAAVQAGYQAINWLQVSNQIEELQVVRKKPNMHTTRDYSLFIYIRYIYIYKFQCCFLM